MKQICQEHSLVCFYRLYRDRQGSRCRCDCVGNMTRTLAKWWGFEPWNHPSILVTVPMLSVRFSVFRRECPCPTNLKHDLNFTTTIHYCILEDYDYAISTNDCWYFMLSSWLSRLGSDPSQSIICSLPCQMFVLWKHKSWKFGCAITLQRLWSFMFHNRIVAFSGLRS